MTKPHKSWADLCEEARAIEVVFGKQDAVAYLGEKFLNVLEVAETDANLRSEIPSIVSQIKSMYDRRQLTDYLEHARQTEPFNPDDYDDPVTAEIERRAELRRSAADLLLVERAKEWLLED